MKMIGIMIVLIHGFVTEDSLWPQEICTQNNVSSKGIALVFTVSLHVVV